MKKFLNFIKYNNVVPVTLSLVLLGAGSALAASPEVRDAAAAAVLSQQSQVVSIDNTYIVNKDLTAYTPRVMIAAVTEDESNYYVAYSLQTIDLAESVWRDVTKQETMTISKADLGPYRDLGVYVTQQLKQIVDRNLSYLKEVQEGERRHVTQAVVATTYGGLIGKFLDTTTETLPGYTPVVVAPAEAYGNGNHTEGGPAGSGSPPTGSGQTNSSGAQVGLQLLGNNPAVVPLGASYIDLGAVLLDPYNSNVGVHIYMNGAEVSSPTIDTSTTTSYAIEYRATDRNGVTVVVRRIVLVGGVADPGGEVSEAGNLAPAPAPAPAAAPESTPSVAPQATTTPAIEPAPEPQATTTPEVAPTPEPVIEPVSETPSPSEPVLTPTPEPTPEPPAPTEQAISTESQ